MGFRSFILILSAAGLAAVASVGLSAPPGSGKCAKDVDCKGKLVCVDGECVEPGAGQEKPKSGCAGNDECKGGRICVDGECRDAPKEPASATCTKDTDCKADRVCVKGVCMSPKDKPKIDKPLEGRSDEVNQPGTGLYWLRCPLGQTWNGYACRGRAERRITWDMAVKACPAGYRLPTRKELVEVLGGCRPGVAEGARGYCAACGRSTNCYTIFGRDRLMYWSSTASAVEPAVAWRVNFGDGGVGGDAMRAGRSVRCVRGK